MSQIDFTDSQQIDAIFQRAVDKAIANKNEKVIIIAALYSSACTTVGM